MIEFDAFISEGEIRIYFFDDDESNRFDFTEHMYIFSWMYQWMLVFEISTNLIEKH